MGIALSAVHGLFTPLQDLLTWLLSPVQPRTLQRRTPAQAVQRPALQSAPTCARRSPSHGTQAVRPLRVVRVMDHNVAGSRMVISGRLADVCAELDRLVALEQAPR